MNDRPAEGKGLLLADCFIEEQELSVAPMCDARVCNSKGVGSIRVCAHIDQRVIESLPGPVGIVCDGYSDTLIISMDPVKSRHHDAVSGVFRVVEVVLLPKLLDRWIVRDEASQCSFPRAGRVTS